MQDILPDSRARETKGRVFRGAQAWVPVFCANCGREGGLCLEQNMTFLFWLCNPCFATRGEIAGTMAVPDQVFYEKMKNEQLEAYGRPLTHNELLAVVAEDASPLARLIKEAPR